MGLRSISGKKRQSDITVGLGVKENATYKGPVYPDIVDLFMDLSILKNHRKNMKRY